MKTKICNKCKEIKSIEEFYKNRNNKDGLYYDCKVCFNRYQKQWLKNNPEKRKEHCRRYRENNPEHKKEYRKNNIEKIKKSNKKYYQENKEKILKQCKKYYKNNCEKKKEYQRNWQKDNKNKYNKYFRKKYKTDSKYKLNHNISTAIYKSLKGNKKGNHWEYLVDCTLLDLIIHLENLFKSGMNWENMGKWHIDHIRPISSFNFNSSNDPEFKECWALENLQPLWAKDNLEKGVIK